MTFTPRALLGDEKPDPTPTIPLDTIARIAVERGPLSEYPIAQRVRRGWQNGITFYPDADVVKVLARYRAVPDRVAPELTAEEAGILVGAYPVDATTAALAARADAKLRAIAEQVTS